MLIPPWLLQQLAVICEYIALHLFSKFSGENWLGEMGRIGGQG